MESGSPSYEAKLPAAGFSKAESSTDFDEGKSICEADVRALPRDQAARKDHGHLQQSATQAAAGLGRKHGSNCRRQFAT